MDSDHVWLAGLLEGEGSFTTTFHRRGETRIGYRYAVVELSMIDEDVVVRAAKILDCNYARRFPPARRKAGWQPQYRLRLEGGKAKTLMRKLKPLMGERRQRQIESALAQSV